MSGNVPSKMFKKLPGRFQYKKELDMLIKLGFTDKKYNKRKLKEYNGDANRIIQELNTDISLKTSSADTSRIPSECAEPKPTVGSLCNAPTVITNTVQQKTDSEPERERQPKSTRKTTISAPTSAAPSPPERRLNDRFSVALKQWSRSKVFMGIYSVH